MQVLGNERQGYPPPPPLPPPPPRYSQHFTPPKTLGPRVCCTWNRGGRAATHADGIVPAEQRRSRWLMFVFGNLLSAAIVVSEISGLSVCFDEFVGDEDDVDSSWSIGENASTNYTFVMITLVFGLWVDVFSAIILSLIYRSPLDAKSAHKIPPEDNRHCGGTVIAQFLVPFSWAVIFLFGGIASMDYAVYSSCGGQDGSGLEGYLKGSGVVMVLCGVALFFVSLMTLFFACGASGNKCNAGCCKTVRRWVHKLLLSKGPYVDLWWQLQGVVWSYRAGSFGLELSILFGVLGVLGEVLAALGSISPDVVQELAGPIGL